MKARALAASFLAGLVFSVGLALSGMTHPSKVIGFLDFFGDWDPALMGVMGGGVLVYLVLYRRILGLGQPLFSAGFQVPTRKDITPRLVIGSALFGMGWGLGGYCPGPAIASLATLSPQVLIFAASMFAGMVLFRVVEPLLDPRSANPQESPSA